MYACLRPAVHASTYLGVMGEFGGVALMMAVPVSGILALAGLGALIAKRVAVEN